MKVLKKVFNQLEHIGVLLLLIPFFASAQDTGIKFETNLSWQAIQAKAKAENKFIFIDCYATWCGPCKFMSNTIFPKKEVGDYMNAHFISVAVQMDKTPKDPESIKLWYFDAKAIGDKYFVSELPTYLFFSPDGQAVHRIVGSTGNEGKDFIEKAKEALDPAKQYYTRQEDYKNHLDDSIYLHDALTEAVAAFDTKNAEAIGDVYLNSLRNPYTWDNLKLLSRVIRSSKDQSFKFFYNNFIKINEIVGQGVFAESIVGNIITQEEIDPFFLQKDLPLSWRSVFANIKSKYPSLPEPIQNIIYGNFEFSIYRTEIKKTIYDANAPLANWTKISKRIKRQYPGYDPERMIVREKPKYYAAKKLWPEYEKSIISYVNKYRDQLGSRELNDLAWGIFMHSNSQKELFEALQWSESIISDSSVYAYMDTHANLLYKMGEKGKAITLETKALALIDGTDTRTLNISRATLAKMQKGEKTWEGRDEHDNYQ